MLSFADIVAPLSEGEFFDRYFTKEHVLLSEKRGARFEEIFSLADLDANLLWHGRPHAAGIRLAKAPDIGYVDSGRPASVDHIAEKYRAGYTVNINGVDDRHPRVRELSNVFLKSCCAKVTTCIFLSPPNERAFPLHFDTHEVFVLQLAGKKHWRLYTPTIDAPTDATIRTRSVSRDEVGAPIFDQTLEAGDVLYVPRGLVHEATTEEAQSLHLTVSVFLPTRHDLLLELLAAEAVRNAELRRPLPRGALASKDVAAEDLEACARAMIAEPRLSVALERLFTRLMEEQLPVAGPRFFAAAPELKLESTLIRRPGLWPHVLADGMRAVFLFQGNRVDAPLVARAALEVAAKNERLEVHALPLASEEGRLALARRLVQSGAFFVEG